MTSLSSNRLHKLLEAIQIIHAHGHGSFHERLFRALDLVFERSTYALELYGRDGSYAAETNVPFNKNNLDEILRRASELVPLQSPMYQRLAAGETQPMRLSDFISLRQLRRTDLYQEVFRDALISRQIGIPWQSPMHLGGITVNRDGSDFSDEDLWLATLLTPQIVTAFESDALIHRLLPAKERIAAVDFTTLRRCGLSRRECEVFSWMSEGKRDAEIAVILNISPRTVNHHVRAILRKLGAETRTAATAAALQRGWLPPAAQEACSHAINRQFCL